MNPLQISEYLVKQNCLTKTDLVRNNNNKSPRYAILLMLLYLLGEGCIFMHFSHPYYTHDIENSFISQKRFLHNSPLQCFLENNLTWVKKCLDPQYKWKILLADKFEKLRYSNIWQLCKESLSTAMHNF